MRSEKHRAELYRREVIAPRLDLIEENPMGLLTRLRSENSALEVLRLALAGDEERLGLN